MTIIIHSNLSSCTYDENVSSGWYYNRNQILLSGRSPCSAAGTSTKQTLITLWMGVCRPLPHFSSPREKGDSVTNVGDMIAITWLSWYLLKNPNPKDISTWRLHVMNKPKSSRPTQQEWKYEPLEVIGRTGRLLALALLDKTETSGEEVSETLRAVEVVQDDMSWNCRTWTFSAIEASSRSLVAHLSFRTHNA